MKSINDNWFHCFSIDFQCFSLIFNDSFWFSLILNDFFNYPQWRWKGRIGPEHPTQVRKKMWLVQLSMGDATIRVAQTKGRFGHRRSLYKSLLILTRSKRRSLLHDLLPTAVSGAWCTNTTGFVHRERSQRGDVVRISMGDATMRPSHNNIDLKIDESSAGLARAKPLKKTTIRKSTSSAGLARTNSNAFGQCCATLDGRCLDEIGYTHNVDLEIDESSAVLAKAIFDDCGRLPMGDATIEVSDGQNLNEKSRF